jgi:hypothetical protein
LGGDVFLRDLGQRTVQQVLEAEMTSFLGAETYQRNGERRSMPRHTMSRSAPFACRHCQASHDLTESLRRLSFGYCSISARIKKITTVRLVAGQ